MADAVITLAARKKMVQARAGKIVLPKIVGIAFGSGGVDTGGNIITPTSGQVGLNRELLRRPVDGYAFPSDTKCRYECTLAEGELAGEYISEAALYDEDGDLVAIKNFLPKGKDGDMEMVIQIDDEF